MSRYTGTAEPRDRATAITAVAAIHIALAALLISGQRVEVVPANTTRTTLIDIALPPPPPPPDWGRVREEHGAAGKKAEPTPVVVPAPRVVVPATRPITAAPLAGSGRSASAGAAAAGSGPGAGGTGSGGGAGGSGGAGGIGSEARLLSGGLTRRDYRSLRAYASSAGRALLSIMVGADGHVANCAVANSSGDPNLDAALCAILQPRMHFSPARDTAGQPIAVRAYYVATWDRG